MYYNPLQVIYGFILVLFLPGYTLIQLLFPRKGELDEEFDMLYRITLGIAMSIAVVILIGFVLGNPSVRLFKRPYLDISLLGISAIFFVGGWYRGAYPWLGRIHPSLYRLAPKVSPDVEDLVSGKEITPTLVELRRLAKERQDLRKKIKEIERKSRISSPSLRKYWENRKNIYLQDLRDVEKKVAELEEKRTDEMQGGLSA
ncbi:MAG: DUF1616 domain-containing protein [Thermoplasmata archaeon]|nr:DUF1616 domain-containing protein [Thermoplasmata archaeon]